MSPGISARRLYLPTQDGTNVDIELSAAVEVAIPAPLARWRVDGSVDAIALQVDEPEGLLRDLIR